VGVLVTDRETGFGEFSGTAEGTRAPRRAVVANVREVQNANMPRRVKSPKDMELLYAVSRSPTPPVGSGARSQCKLPPPERNFLDLRLPVPFVPDLHTLSGLGPAIRKALREADYRPLA
jgi:hypothetical protein